MSKKLILLGFACLAVVCLWRGVAAEVQCTEEAWKDFKAEYGRTYAGEEDVNRKYIFCDNLRKIEEHNAKYDRGEVSFKMGVNRFADWTEEEFRKWVHQGH